MEQTTKAVVVIFVDNQHGTVSEIREEVSTNKRPVHCPICSVAIPKHCPHGRV